MNRAKNNFKSLLNIVIFKNKYFMETKIIAHRGAWKEFDLPENSIASFRKAIELRCFGVELDVHLSKDGIVVVHHDHDFYGLDIENSNFDDLLSKEYSNGEKIAALKEFFEIGSTVSVKLFVEIKTSNCGRTKTLVDAVCELLSVNNFAVEIAFILFDYEAALYLNDKAKNYEIHYLNGDKTAEEIKMVGLSGMDYNYQLLIDDDRVVKSFRKMRLKTNSWTVNDWEIAQKLMKQKIDFLTTDYPKLFLNKMV